MFQEVDEARGLASSNALGRQQQRGIATVAADLQRAVEAAALAKRIPALRAELDALIGSLPRRSRARKAAAK